MRLPRINDKLSFWARKIANPSSATLYITPDLGEKITIEAPAGQGSPYDSKPCSEFGKYATYEFTPSPPLAGDWAVKVDPGNAVSTRRAWLLVDYMGTA